MEKKFPRNVRALRMLAEEIVCSVLDVGCFDTSDNLMVLGERANQSKTIRLWVDVLIKLFLLTDGVHQS